MLPTVPTTRAVVIKKIPSLLSYMNEKIIYIKNEISNNEYDNESITFFVLLFIALIFTSNVKGTEQHIFQMPFIITGGKEILLPVTDADRYLLKMKPTNSSCGAAYRTF